MAEENVIKQLIVDITKLGGQPVVEQESARYARIRMADSCYVELVTYPDSFIVIQTICAPICSSHARVYNKEWNLIHDIKNDSHMAFPYATVTSDGIIEWIDNMVQMLDDTEKKK